MPFEPFVEVSDRARMLEDAMLVQPVRHRERLAVIGDREILQARRERRTRHGFHIGAAVALSGVRVKVATEIGLLDQARQRASLGRLYLAAVFPELGRYEGQPQRGIQLPLRRRRPRATSSSRRKSPYSLSVNPRASARSRRAMLWAFDPVKYWSAAPRLSEGTSRRSAWNPPDEQDAGLGVAMHEDSLDEAMVREGVHHVG